jgi:hypothetical protein
VSRVEVGIDDDWRLALLEPASGRTSLCVVFMPTRGNRDDRFPHRRAKRRNPTGVGAAQRHLPRAGDDYLIPRFLIAGLDPAIHPFQEKRFFDGCPGQAGQA